MAPAVAAVFVCTLFHAGPAGAEPTASGCAGRATIVGSDSDDRIIGTPSDDIIDGRGGADRIKGLSGDDYICGGDGDDIVYAGRGRDHAVGGLDDDYLQGGGGADALDGEDGDDRLRDGRPNVYSRVVGGAGNDVFEGGVAWFGGSAEGVRVDLEAGTATGEGDDTLIDVHGVRGSPQNDVLLGSAADEYLQGEAGNDVLDGRAGGDHLYGDFSYADVGALHGDDDLRGGPGHDELVGDSQFNRSATFGNDVLDGGDGTDLLDHFGTHASMVVDLEKGLALGEGADALSDVENVTGSFSDANTLRGDDTRNVLEGGNKSDRVDAGGGHDLVLDNWGSDDVDLGEGDDIVSMGSCFYEGISIDGGAGMDTVSFEWAYCNDGFVVDLTEQTFSSDEDGAGTLRGFENVAGSWKADTFYGTDGPNHLQGSLAGDRLFGRGGSDRLDGGDGDDTLDGGDGIDRCTRGESLSACE